MGFSTALQGRAAHEALVMRQDAELRLMETMKRCFQMKAKCDREYAASLATVAQQGLKIDRADDMQGSLITKSWRSYMDELDQQAKQFRINAELLEVICEKLAHLSQDKRKARKSYQEEHAKIAVRLNHLTDEVLRKKSEYQKHLEGYKALRTRFEEHYIKCGRGGRKLDDVRDKYQKACRKLHLTHNEYVLSITEAVEVEKDFRTVLLPGLLEHQQSVQESFILLWKNILQEASQHGDLTSEKFKEIQKRIDNVINKINPNEEYREFTEKHKQVPKLQKQESLSKYQSFLRTSPSSPIVFQFDETLIEDIPGKLQSNTLTVDNLTVDWLRSRLNDLEGSVKECQEKQIKMIGDLNGGSPIANGVNGISNKDSQNRNSKDLNSLRCQEKQKQKLLDMIKSALSEVGCEELPSGCDDHLNVDPNFIENSFNNDNQTRPSANVSNMNDLIRRGGVLTLLRGPFKRKAATPQPTTPTSTIRNRNRFNKNMQPRSQSLGSLSVINDVCKTNLRLSASVEANNNYDSDDIVVFDPLPQSPKPVSTARHSSMLCVIEEPSTNIYSELEVNDNQFAPIVPSNTNLSSSSQQSVQIEINHIAEEDHSSLTLIPPLPFTGEGDNTEPVVKSSIDAHLDKIDEINRSLDDKLKRSLPQTRFLQTTTPSDLNAIEPSPDVEHRLSANEIQECSSKRTSSSSSDTRPSITRKQSTTPVGKKRSISFSHKSINSILTNIKDFKFPRSPLTRGLRSNSSTEDHEINEILEGVTVLSKKPGSIENTTLPMIETSTDCSESEATSKSRTKTPKVKKTKAIRNTFRTKLISFQMRRGKTCKSCAKKRRIHPSKSVFDFAKDFNLTSWNEDDFCACPDDTNHLHTVSTATNTTNALIEGSGEETNDENDEDVLSIKDHKYCEPNIAGMSLSSNRPLYEEEWFHGVLPREEVVRLLNNDGDFLVRETIRNEESQIVLSVCWNGHKHFIVQTTVDGHFRFEGPPFPSIQELIMHQYQSELPVTVKSGAILRRPICRERWELSNDDVVLLEKIGRGNFGDVYKAKLKSTKQDVAVKTCRMTLPEEQKRKFLQEGRILKQYDHPNIVKLIGICVQKQPIMIVMELVPGGSLLNFLRKNSNSLTTRQLMGMCRDAAAGMRYLESKNCIHRDLAARNCLIDLENSVRISDFGMSREEEEYIVSDGMKQIPVKWTAPEALNFGKYTCLCDVWSYGILMWEIFSKGDTPYSGMSNSRARERIDTGFRMPAPENTPPEMYRLMLKCWAAEAESRPHFDEIFNVVDALIIRYDNTSN